MVVESVYAKKSLFREKCSDSGKVSTEEENATEMIP